MRYKFGAILLSIVLFFNFVAGLAVLTWLFLFKANAPAVFYLFSKTEVETLDPKILATVNGLAVIANASLVAFCGVIWIFLRKRLLTVAWGFWTASTALLFLQGCAYLSDSYFMNKNLIPNLISAGLLITGLVLIYPATKEKRPL